MNNGKGNARHAEGKEQMWQLYNQLGSYAKVAKKLHRSSDTVSRYVREFEAAVGAARVVLNAK